MAAFALAKEYGAPGLELDVHLCATGELVVVHDANFLRTTGADLDVAAASVSRIKELDAGSSFGPAFAGERVPLLNEVLDAFSGELYIDIELKSKKVWNDPLPKALAALLRDRAKTAKGLERRITVSSFNPFALAAFKRAAPEFATAIIWSGHEELPFYLRRGQGRWISGCDYLKPIKTMAAPLPFARAIGRPMVAWTADDIELAAELVKKGCAGVVTNRPQDIVVRS
jgi:glycerophosphoryl diester phosphodiesterase